jgi:hypothetical protein
VKENVRCRLCRQHCERFDGLFPQNFARARAQCIIRHEYKYSAKYLNRARKLVKKRKRRLTNSSSNLRVHPHHDNNDRCMQTASTSEHGHRHDASVKSKRKTIK